MAGGSTTPARRADLGLGGAARIALGGLAERTGADASLKDVVGPGGVTPLAYARAGVAPHWDVGLSAASTTLRGELRGELLLDAKSSLRPALLVAAAVFGGPVHDDGAFRGGRVGAGLPLLLVLDASSLVELWVGPRVRIERVWAEIGPGDAPVDGAATGIGLGGVIGVAVGFRHLHALAELSAAWERWSGTFDGDAALASGVVLTPAFGLRLRL